MQHLDFILWMTLFPISTSICRYIESMVKDKKQYSESAELFASISILVLWFGIGYSLY